MWVDFFLSLVFVQLRERKSKKLGRAGEIAQQLRALVDHTEDRGPGFHSKHPHFHSSSPLSVMPVSGDPAPSSGLLGH